MILSVLIVISIFALLSVRVKDLLRGGICLAVSSALLAMVIFHYGMPYAAVFELSVAAGLITVLFIATISLVRPPGQTEREVGMIPEKGSARARLFEEDARERRFMKYLPIAVILFAVVLWELRDFFPSFPSIDPPEVASFSQTLWQMRSLDLLGQIIAILCGVFLVTLFFKERES